ncbi:unnamed protein product, partial [Notodromas monacha]
MGLSRVLLAVVLFGCVVCCFSTRTNTELYPRQRRGSDQRLAELEALLTLTKFIKEKQAQEAMFDNIGKRRRRGIILADDGDSVDHIQQIKPEALTQLQNYDMV